MTDNRYSIVLLFDVTEGNPNGDPDGGNKPRINPITGCGKVSNHSLKRKMRDALKTMFDEALYVERGVNLTDVQNDIAKNVLNKTNMKACGKKPADKAAAVQAMVSNFIDVRLFGCVVTQISTGITGPVQVTDAVSVDPIRPSSMTVTCCAGSGSGDDSKDRTKNMGSRWIVPYGLYAAHIDITPTACRNGDYSEEDLEKLFCVIEHMFDLHKTSTSGEQCLRKFVVFKHSSKFGDQPCHELYDAVKVRRLCDGLPKSFDDYEVFVDRDAVKDSIDVDERV